MSKRKSSSMWGLVIVGILLLASGAIANNVTTIFIGTFAIFCGVILVIKEKLEARKLKKALGE